VGEVGAKRREGVSLFQEAELSFLLNRLRNDLLTSLTIAQHIVVPEAQHLEALRPEPRGPDRISSFPARLVVLSAVDLDHDAPAEPDEVDDLRSDRCLAAEWNGVIAKRPQQTPHLAFRIRLTAPQALGGRARADIDI
jgi:hypothetical protein